MKRYLLAATMLLATIAHAATITDVRVSGAGPVTFGQVFAVGEMKKTDVLVGKLDGAIVPLQVDIKALHADGSVRHAIVSAIVPKIVSGEAGTMTLATGGTIVPSTVTPDDLLATGFTASTSATITGVKYSASADQMLKALSKSTWLAGAVANEWQVSAPLTTGAGVEHPHLQARFAIRYYTAVNKARVDITIENNWAYEPGPQNFVYDADITIGGKSVYSKAGLTHYHHARWRKLFWWGDAPTAAVQLNTKYLIASKAVPNYDQAPGISERLLAGYSNVTVEPMGAGLATPYMPTTGAHNDIGILPQWQSAYALSMDARARSAMLSTADGAGSFPMHYRDRVTDRPVTLTSHPRMTILGRPGDSGSDSFPGCAGDCNTPYTPDVAHQPSFAYLPYLVTGDYFYLEELQFWAMYDAFNDNPGYRGAEKGIVSPAQVRGQAWSLRTLAQGAYATPDADPIKNELLRIVDNNLNWYNDTYTSGGANKLGVITNGYAVEYNGGTGIAPWQDDHFTSAVGHAVELGFSKAEPLLKWKAKFQVGRLSDPGFCWIDATAYSLKIRDTSTSPFYETLAQVYQGSVDPKLSALKCNTPEQLAYRNSIRASDEGNAFVLNDMPGYASSNAGYPSNFQPALAMAVDSGYPGGLEAWRLFATRAVRPDYSNGNQFSIVPRLASAALISTVPVPTVPSGIGGAVIVSAPTVAGTWAKIASENSAYTVPADVFVRYGVGTSWIYSKGPGIGSNPFFGKDPAPNVVKTVEVFTPAPVVIPAKVTTGSNSKLAKQGSLTVTFIHPAKFALVKTFTGVVATSKGAFTVSDVLLVPGTQYLVVVGGAGGKLLDAFLLTVPK